MKAHTFRKSLITLAIMGLSGPVLGQDTDTADTKGKEDVERVEVRGTRANLQSAQALKRNSETVVDSITASDIGILPDRSVLEAIQRLPGVSVERFAGPDDPDHFSVEGSGAIIRGMTQTRSEFNGRDSFTANSGRGLSFQDVSPELMGGVDVFKNQTADMIEGGIGGTVNLRTRKPFDSDEQVFAFNVDYSYGDLAEKGSATYSFLYSNQWELESGAKFGFLGNFADSQLYGESHGIQSDAYVEQYASQLAGAEAFVGNDGNGTVWLPNAANALKKFDDRKRQGISAALQFESADETFLSTFQYIRSDSQLSWHEQAIKYQGGYRDINDRHTRALDGTSFEFDDQGLFESGVMTQGVDGWRAADGNANNGYIARAWGTNAQGQWGHKTQYDSRVKDTETLVEDFSLNMRWRANDNLVLTGDIQYVKAETSDDDVVLHTGGFAAQAYDVTGSTPTLTMIDPWLGNRDANPDAYASGYPGFSLDPAGDTNYFGDPHSYFLRSAMDHYERSEGDSLAVRFDGKYHLESDSVITSIQAGARYAKREQTVRSTSWNWGSLDPEFTSADDATAGWLPLLPGGYNDDYELVDWSDFHGGGVVNIPGNNTIHASESFVRAIMGANPDRLPYQSSGGDWTPYPQRDGVDAEFGIFTPGEVNKTTETNKALYVRVNFEGQGDLRYSGNVGLRYVKLDRDATGAVLFPDLVPDFAAPAGANYPITPEYVLGHVQQQVIDGIFPDIETALRSTGMDADGNPTGLPDNRWIGDNKNYLSADNLAFGDDSEQAIAAKTDFTMWLPSFNIKVELTDELIGRFAFSKAVALPDMDDIRARADLGAQSVNSVRPIQTPDPDNPPAPQDNLVQYAYINAWTGSGGNPYLKPMESVQYDFALEWYFADVGQLSATIFHKDLKNYFIQGAAPINYTNPNTGISQTVLVDGTTNGGDGKMDGIEVSYQQFFDQLPAPWDGLGVQATYTYIDAGGVPNNNIDAEDESWAGNPDTDTGIRVALDSIPLEGQSKETVNLTGMYEKNGWSVRLAYNWRSRYLLTTRDVISKAPLWYDDHGQLDGSVFYNINDNFTIGFQGTNLTDSQSETIMLLNNEGLEAGRSWFVSDRRIAFVLKGNF